MIGNKLCYNHLINYYTIINRMKQTYMIEHGKISKIVSITRWDNVQNNMYNTHLFHFSPNSVLVYWHGYVNI